MIFGAIVDNIIKVQMKKIFKELIFWVIFGVFFWVVFTHFAEVEHILDVLAKGKWYWIAPALVCQLIYYPFYTGYLKRVFALFRVHLSKRSILPVYIASKFAAVALPLSTFGAVAVFIRNGKKKNLSGINVGVGILSAMIMEIITFIAISALTVVVLYFLGQQRTYLMVSLLFLASAIGVLALIVIWIALEQKPLNRPMLWMIKGIAKLAGQGHVKIEEIQQIAQEIGSDLLNGKDKIWPLFRQAFMTHALNLLTFCFIYLAFVGNLNVLAIITSYVASLLFTIVSITPQGIGVAETVTITTLHSFGLDLATSAAITLAFRGLLYWIPMFPGFYAFSKIEIEARKNRMAI